MRRDEVFFGGIASSETVTSTIGSRADTIAEEELVRGCVRERVNSKKKSRSKSKYGV